MGRQTSQTETIATPSSKNEDILDRILRILKPFKSDRWLVAAVYGAIAAIGLSIWTLVWNWSDLQTNPSEQAKKRFDASLSVISTGATIAAGVVLYLNFIVANRNAEIAQKKLDQETEKARQDAELAEARLVSERFSKAIEMLGNDKSIHLRLGGIYALESIANDSDPDIPDEIYRQVIAILTAFVRENSPYPPKENKKLEPAPYSEPLKASTVEAEENAGKKEESPLPTDIQAVLNVLSRRRHRDKDWKKYFLDLTNTDLGHATLSYANLQKAFLVGVNLQKASLMFANLQEAKLGIADLQEATLWYANLQKAFLSGANLQNAGLRRANLQEAKLWRVNLQNADVLGANLQRADLLEVNLQEANLREVNLQKATLGKVNLDGADLLKANFKEAKFWELGLTDTELAEAKEQTRANLQSAQNWEKAKYDSEIRELLGLPPETVQLEEDTR